MSISKNIPQQKHFTTLDAFPYQVYVVELLPPLLPREPRRVYKHVWRGAEAIHALLEGGLEQGAVSDVAAGVPDVPLLPGRLAHG